MRDKDGRDGCADHGDHGEKRVMVWVDCIEDIRPIDFDSGKRLAITGDAMETCGCCGRKIMRVAVLSNGDRIGTECAAWIERPDTIALCQPRFTKKQIAYYSGIGMEI